MIERSNSPESSYSNPTALTEENNLKEYKPICKRKTQNHYKNCLLYFAFIIIIYFSFFINMFATLNSFDENPYVELNPQKICVPKLEELSHCLASVDQMNITIIKINSTFFNNNSITIVKNDDNNYNISLEDENSGAKNQSQIDEEKRNELNEINFYRKKLRNEKCLEKNKNLEYCIEGVIHFNDYCQIYLSEYKLCKAKKHNCNNERILFCLEGYRKYLNYSMISDYL